MKNRVGLGQGLACAAWLVFIASLFMPMETHSLASPCAWPCAQPFTYYGWQNATFFTLSMLTFMSKWMEVIYIAVFDPVTLRKIIESMVIMGIHALIGLGQILIAVALLWPAKIKRTGWQKLHLGVVLLSALSAIAYGLFPNLRLGLEILRGYYVWVLSFVLLFLASVWMQINKNGDSRVKQGQAPDIH